jgi:hypothetical protein
MNKPPLFYICPKHGVGETALGYGSMKDARKTPCLVCTKENDRRAMDVATTLTRYGCSYYINSLKQDAERYSKLRAPRAELSVVEQDTVSGWVVKYHSKQLDEVVDNLLAPKT